MLQDTLLQHIQVLIQDGETLRQSNSDGQALNEGHIQRCQGYLNSAHALLTNYFRSNNGYYLSMRRILDGSYGWTIPNAVGSICESLKRMKYDIENGFLKGVESQISAEIFDTFLEHGEKYLKNSKKNEAGVIIGVTFEDTTRRFARLNDIEENGVKLDEVISRLQNSELFTPIEAKRARSCAAVRTSAAHAKWEEFTEQDVKATLDFTKQLIEKVDHSF